MTLSLKENPDSLYPPSVLDEKIGDCLWWVAHTKSRREKALASFLARSQIGYYLPLYQKKHPSRPKSRFSLVPMFPGYLFFKANNEEYDIAYRSNHLAGIIKVSDCDKLITELIQVRKILDSKLPVYPYDYVEKGQKILVKYGPLKGLEGVIVKKKGDYRLVITVASVFQSFAVDVDIESEMVEPLVE